MQNLSTVLVLLYSLFGVGPKNELFFKKFITLVYDGTELVPYESVQ